MENRYNKEYIDKILNEQNFPYERMSIEERNLCLKYLMLTYNFSESNNSNDNKTNIIQCKFNKNDGKYTLNGIGYIQQNNNEFINLTFDSEITFKDNSIWVLSEITYLYTENNTSIKTKELETYDKFSKNNNKLTQTSYSFNPNKKIEKEYNLPDDFNKFYELSKISNDKSIKK